MANTLRDNGHHNESPESVAELAILTIPLLAPPPAPMPTTPSETTGPDPSLQPKISPEISHLLQKAKAAMEDFTSLQFAYFRLFPGSNYGTDRSTDVTTGHVPMEEEMIDILLIGGWPSVQTHMNDWLPSETNQGLVRELGAVGVGVRWMWHVGIPREDVEKVIGAGGSREMRVWRGVARDGQAREGVARELGALNGLAAGEEVVWGWRLDAGYYEEGEEDGRAEMGAGAEEVVVFVREGGEGSARKGVERVLKGLEGVVVVVEDRRAVPLDS